LEKIRIFIMFKFFKYVFTHFKIKVSHPEQTQDRGWEIRWTFFNISFLKRGNFARIKHEICLREKNFFTAYICEDENGILWFGWLSGNTYVFVDIDFCDRDLLMSEGRFARDILEISESSQWCTGTKENDGFRLTKQRGEINPEFKLPPGTITC